MFQSQKEMYNKSLKCLNFKSCLKSHQFVTATSTGPHCTAVLKNTVFLFAYVWFWLCTGDWEQCSLHAGEVSTLPMRYTQPFLHF